MHNASGKHNDPQDPRRPKRPRLMAPPDGFTKPKLKALPKSSVPRFTSAFDSSSTTDPTPAARATKDHHHLHTNHLPILPIKFDERISSGAPPDGFTRPKLKALPKSSVPRFTSAFDSSSTTDPIPAAKLIKDHHHLHTDHLPKLPVKFDERTSLEAPRKFMRALKPPMPVLSRPKPQVETLTPANQRKASNGSYEHVQPPSVDPALKPLPLFHHLPPPPLPPATSSKKMIQLMTIPHPLPPVEPVSKAHTKAMLTISTTRIALATDLTSADGPAEVLSILLQDRQHDLSSSNDTDLESRRGMTVSPEKSMRGRRGPKFIRNGLAERASQILSQSHTSLSLWQKEIETIIRSSSVSQPLKPDLRFHLLKILHTPTPSSYSGIAQCRLYNSPSAHGGMCLALLSFAPSAPLSSTTSFAEGREVYVWHPWHEVKVAAVPTCTGTVPDAYGVCDALVAHPAMPVDIPVLICSRFLIVQ